MKEIRKIVREVLSESFLNENQLRDLNDDDVTEMERIDFVINYPESIEKIINPSERVQLAAVETDGTAIQYIDDPTEAVKLAAINKDSYAIKYIDFPSDELKLIALIDNPDLKRFIPNLSPNLQAKSDLNRWMKD
tara:strand:- start:1464 stop:1868 length:405 start_codon:yes stop_codon:yes gene_type:complete